MPAARFHCSGSCLRTSDTLRAGSTVACLLSAIPILYHIDRQTNISTNGRVGKTGDAFQNPVTLSTLLRGNAAQKKPLFPCRTRRSSRYWRSLHHLGVLADTAFTKATVLTAPISSRDRIPSSV